MVDFGARIVVCGWVGTWIVDGQCMDGGWTVDGRWMDGGWTVDGRWMDGGWGCVEHGWWMG